MNGNNMQNGNVGNNNSNNDSGSNSTTSGNDDDDSPICTGNASQACSIANGQGLASRTCNQGEWSDWGSCQLISCDSGYEEMSIPDITEPLNC